MTIVILVSAALVVATTLLHYEALRGLNSMLPRLSIPGRTKVLAVMIVAFVAHAVEIVLYGGAIYVLVEWLGQGTLAGATHVTPMVCINLSAESYTSLGFGDVAPMGPVRLIAGVEALNGLLLIGWTASFTYLEMERYWRAKPGASS